MTYADALTKLEELRELVDKVNHDRSAPEEERWARARRMQEKYGEVEEIYLRFAGTKEVLLDEGRQKKTFGTYFEAGYLSGRTFYAGEGLAELNKVIGRVRVAASDPSVPRDERTVTTVIEILQRFRQCCQYVKSGPVNERDVQDFIWIMLRSRFDRLDREDTLPRFGAKKYAPDFGIPELRLLIEVKFIGDATRPAAIQEEILADIPGYLQDRSKYDSIVVFIYDGAHKIRDDRKLIDDLRTVTGIVDVVIAPGIQ